VSAVSLKITWKSPTRKRSASTLDVVGLRGWVGGILGDLRQSQNEIICDSLLVATPDIGASQCARLEKNRGSQPIN
jgi:hypothetical protein